MARDKKTPTDKPPMPPIPAPTRDAPTIEIEADDAGELREAVTAELEGLEADAGDDQAEKPRELCGVKCGTSKIGCGLDKGHEVPGHPAYIANQFGEALHESRTLGGLRWAVDVEASEAATEQRNRQLLADAQELDRLSKLGHE